MVGVQSIPTHARLYVNFVFHLVADDKFIGWAHTTIVNNWILVLGGQLNMFHLWSHSTPYRFPCRLSTTERVSFPHCLLWFLVKKQKVHTKRLNTLPACCEFCDLACVTHVDYFQISDISRTKSQNLNVSRLVLQLSLCNILKPGVKSRMKMLLEQCWEATLELHLSDR